MKTTLSNFFILIYCVLFKKEKTHISGEENYTPDEWNSKGKNNSR